MSLVGTIEEVVVLGKTADGFQRDKHIQHKEQTNRDIWLYPKHLRHT